MSNSNSELSAAMSVATAFWFDVGRNPRCTVLAKRLMRYEGEALHLTSDVEALDPRELSDVDRFSKELRSPFDEAGRIAILDRGLPHLARFPQHFAVATLLSNTRAKLEVPLLVHGAFPHPRDGIVSVLWRAVVAVRREDLYQVSATINCFDPSRATGRFSARTIGLRAGADNASRTLVDVDPATIRTDVGAPFALPACRSEHVVFTLDDWNHRSSPLPPRLLNPRAERTMMTLSPVPSTELAAAPVSPSAILETAEVRPFDLWREEQAPFPLAPPSADGVTARTPRPVPWKDPQLTAPRATLEPDRADTLASRPAVAAVTPATPATPVFAASPEPLPAAVVAPIAPLADAAPAPDLRETVLARVRGRLSLRDLDLRGVDLSGADLSNAQLAGLDLTEAKLVGANLAGADLSGAVLDDASLVNARLSNADFTQATARGASFVGATGESPSFGRGNYDRADFTGATLASPDFTNATLGSARFLRFTATEARFTSATAKGACFDTASLAGATFKGATLDDCSFDGLVAPGSDWHSARLTRCLLDNANLDQSVWTRAVCASVVFRGAHLRRAIFQQASAVGGSFEDADLEGADFRKAKLERAWFSRARLVRVMAAAGDLTGCTLSGVDLREASLRDAVLRGAQLIGAHLDEVDLRDADLEGANLTGATRRGAKLAGAKTRGLIDDVTRQGA
jgi:uncharacterized protein YjbI with pentapeptide repeats